MEYLSYQLSEENCSCFMNVNLCREDCDDQDWENYSLNYNYKDSLFRFLFGSSERKKELLELYNALNDSSYSDTADLEIRTLDDFIYLAMKNDVSFMVGNHLVLYEHQSKYNPNMPLRGFFYYASLYHGLIYPERKHDIYQSKLIKIPTPQYVVFYNGISNMEDRVILRLSDAFECPDKTNGFEWTATMININYGHNKELMLKCKILEEYSIFIAKIREYQKHGYSVKQAISCAIDYCIANNILAELLSKHKAEVKKMLFREFKFEEYDNYMKKTVNDLEKNIETQQDQIQEQQGQIQTQQDQLQEQQGQIQKQQDQLQEQQGQIQEQQSQINKQQSQLQEKDSKIEEYEAILKANGLLKSL